MIALQFRKSIPRYFALRWFGPRWPGLYTSAASSLHLCDLPAPALPTPGWVRVRPILSGICGSDLATLTAKGSPYLAPLVSMPFVPGHEVVGRVSEVGAHATGVSVGDRVVLQPALGCRVRGIDPLCDACAAGDVALCRNVLRGDIAEGIQTGYCRSTGGAWSDEFVAHPSQLYRVPDALEDTLAVLVEPFACALHGVLRAMPEREAASGSGGLLTEGTTPPNPSDSQGSMRSVPTVFVLGCGAIGLLTIAAIRALNRPARIVALAKYPHQRQHAERLGVDLLIPFARDTESLYRSLANALDAECHQPDIGKPTVIGGADVTFDCVASSSSIDDACRFTRAGGVVGLVGMPGIPRGIDWTSIWYKELSVRAAYAYGVEAFGGERVTTFELALRLLVENGEALRSLVGEPFALRDHRAALQSALFTGRSRSVKTVFRVAGE